jgi:hypothetical protein
VVVSKTQDVNTVLSSKTIYLLEEFTDGVVYYANGRTARGKLNYHLLNDEVHFIDPDDKILKLSEPLTINFISIGRKTFVYNSRYKYMEVAHNGDIKLLIKRNLQVKEKDYEYVGAYGESSSSGVVKSGNNAVLGGWNVAQFGDENNIVEGEILFTVQYFLLDKSKRTNLIVNLRPFEKAVGKNKRDELREFYKSENIDLKNQDDLKKLTEFANKITATNK